MRGTIYFEASIFLSSSTYNVCECNTVYQQTFLSAHAKLITRQKFLYN